MRVATLAYPEFRSEMAYNLKRGRKAARENHLVGVVTVVASLRSAGYLKLRHVKTLFRPWNTGRVRAGSSAVTL